MVTEAIMGVMEKRSMDTEVITAVKEVITVVMEEKSMVMVIKNTVMVIRNTVVMAVMVAENGDLLAQKTLNHLVFDI